MDPGERCMAISCSAVGEVAEPLVNAISDRIDNLKIGPGMQPDSEMGPLQEHRPSC